MQTRQGRDEASLISSATHTVVPFWAADRGAPVNVRRVVLCSAVTTGSALASDRAGFDDAGTKSLLGGLSTGLRPEPKLGLGFEDQTGHGAGVKEVLLAAGEPQDPPDNRDH